MHCGPDICTAGLSVMITPGPQVINQLKHPIVLDLAVYTYKQSFISSPQYNVLLCSQFAIYHTRVRQNRSGHFRCVIRSNNTKIGNITKVGTEFFIYSPGYKRSQR